MRKPKEEILGVPKPKFMSQDFNEPEDEDLEEVEDWVTEHWRNETGDDKLTLEQLIWAKKKLAQNEAWKIKKS